MNSIEIAVFSSPGPGARKSDMAEAVYRQNLTFVVSPKYLSNKPKIYMFIARIPRVVHIVFFLDFSKILFFLLLVDIYRHPLLIALGPMRFHIHNKGEQVVRSAAPLFVLHSICDSITSGFIRSHKRDLFLMKHARFRKCCIYDN